MAEVETADVTMTVTTANPLHVTADAADTAAPAEALNGTSYQLGDRVNVKIRNPRRPLVTGKVES